MGSTSKEFSYYLSCDINLPVKVRICNLHGVLPCRRPPYLHDPPTGSSSSRGVPLQVPVALHVVAQLVADGEVLGLDVMSTSTEAGPFACSWDEWLTFCVRYKDLPPDTYLCFTVHATQEGVPPYLLGSTAMPMFSKKGRLKTCGQQLRLWEGAPLDLWSPDLVLGKVPVWQRPPGGQLQHLLKLYSRGELAHCSWLDSLAMKEIASVQAAELQASAFSQLLLLVELPLFTAAVLYQQPMSSAAVVAQAARRDKAAAAAAAAAAATGAVDLAAGLQGLILLDDPEVGWENPAELKAQKLARSLTRGLIDRDLKPNSEERKAIARVLASPPNKPLAPDERELLWRFRYSLTGDKRALTKFLKCVDWSDVQEAKQAAQLMRQWAPIEVADALELLSPDFKNDEVRAHAVSVLQRKEDDELLYYLLQLVQALRFEVSDTSRLASFLILRAVNNPAFATFLHWYLFTECEDPLFGPRASAVHGALVNALTSAPKGESVWQAIRRQTDMVSQLSYIVKELKALRLKAARGTERLREMVAESGPCSELTLSRVPLPLNPCLLLEGLVPSESTCYKSAMLPVKLSFRLSPRPIDWTSEHPLQPSTTLSTVGSGSTPAVPFGSEPTGSPGSSHGPSSTSPTAGGSFSGGQGGSLGDTSAAVARSSPPSAAAAAAALPASTGVVVQGDQLRCIMIYKKGDDLRQDQFILQMISLMDSLLKRESLDLHLTPYKVLPTGGDDGLVEFVPSLPLSRVIAEHRTLHRYLALSQADPSGPFGLRVHCVETFVRSCAGYCVMTYILGVGDRHLDNLMLAPDGRLFHIDFGYILGNDPKPFPPPMKLCREMVEAMGGQDSAYYAQFRMLACEAYNILRKSAALIMSLFHLMAGASIEAIRVNPGNAMLKLQEKLRLELDDAQAVDWMQQLINESATALMPQIVETTHRWAQYWR